MTFKAWMVEALIPWLATGTGFIVVFGALFGVLSWRVVAVIAAFWVIVLFILAFGPERGTEEKPFRSRFAERKKPPSK